MEMTLYKNRRNVIMENKFKALTVVETQQLDDLLAIAESIINNKESVIKGNKKAATIVGTAIVAAGTAIAMTGTAGIATTATGIVGFSSIAAGGLGGAAIIALPVVVTAIIGGGVGLFFWKKKKINGKEKNSSTRHDSFTEKQRQAMYVKTIVEKMEKILQAYEQLKKEYDNLKTKSKKDDNTIKQQKEKLAEYEVIFEALKKKRKEIETNLSYA